jgi:hypothetical protein
MTSTRPILVLDLNDTLYGELTSARIGARAAAAAGARSMPPRYGFGPCDIIHIGDNAAKEFIGLRLPGCGTISVLTGRPAAPGHDAEITLPDLEALTRERVSSLHRAWWRPTQRNRRHDD